MPRLRVTVHQLQEAAKSVEGQNPASLVDLERADGAIARTAPLVGHVSEYVDSFLAAASPTSSHVGFSIPPLPAPDGA